MPRYDRGMMHTLATLFARCIAFCIPPSPEALTVDRITTETLACHVATRARHAHTAFFPYRTPLVTLLVRQMKYHNNSHAATLIGETIAPHIAELLAELQSFVTFSAPLVVPVPLHRARLRERGFNQSERIARALIAALPDTHLTLAPKVLIRHKHTEQQTRQHSRAARARNLADAFSVPARHAHVVRGADIILIDDVVTTGATLNSARTALLTAGARHVEKVACCW
jgi:ComF family protein